MIIFYVFEYFCIFVVYVNLNGYIYIYIYISIYIHTHTHTMSFGHGEGNFDPIRDFFYVVGTRLTDHRVWVFRDLVVFYEVANVVPDERDIGIGM